MSFTSSIPIEPLFISSSISHSNSNMNTENNSGNGNGNLLDKKLIELNQSLSDDKSGESLSWAGKSGKILTEIFEIILSIGSEELRRQSVNKLFAQVNIKQIQNTKLILLINKLHSSGVSSSKFGKILAEMVVQIEAFGNNITALNKQNFNYNYEDEIKRLEKEVSVALPKDEGDLAMRMKQNDFTILDVRNIFSARKKLEEQLAMAEKLMNISTFKIMKEREINLGSAEELRKEIEEQKESARKETMKKISKTVQNGNGDHDAKIVSELEHTLNLLKGEKAALLQSLTLLEQKISIAQNDLNALLAKKKTQSVSDEAIADKDVSKTQLGIDEISSFHQASIINLIQNNANPNLIKQVNTALINVDDEKMLMMLYRYLNVLNFCMENLSSSKTALVNEQHHVRKLMHGKTETRVEHLESRETALSGEIQFEQNKIDEIISEAKSKVRLAGEVICSLYSKTQVDLPRSTLLVIWKIRDYAKNLRLEDELQTERFSFLLPENVGKIKLEKKPNKTRPKSGAKPDRDAESSASSVPVEKKDIAPTPPPAPIVKKSVPLRAPVKVPVKSSAWGGWSKPSAAGESNQKSLLEIQKEESEQQSEEKPVSSTNLTPKE